MPDPEPLRLILSGCHSGPNPSPGLGVARSLRLAYPKAQLVARDFSGAATGLHDAGFDEVWLAPPWQDADLAVAWRHLEERLEHTWMMPMLDAEIRWLAGFAHPKILAPSDPALRQVTKPAIAAAKDLPLRLPEWIAMHDDVRAVHRFCQRQSWRVWIKGPTSEARAAGSWPETEGATAELGGVWGLEDLFLQQHIDGEEVSLAYAAFEGELLGSAFLEKGLRTAAGKAWSGEISDPPPSLRTALERVLCDLEWTGGGELECIRDWRGELWLFDWNPRFPAWIHGATLAGRNLPAALVARATDQCGRRSRRRAGGFVRIVTEIPQRLPIPSTPPTPFPALRGEGKHPSGMPLLQRQLAETVRRSVPREVQALPRTMEQDLLEVARQDVRTPGRVLLPRTASVRFAAMASLQHQSPGLEIAYSVKTNPDARLLALALEHGFGAEVISAGEVAWALRCGFSSEQLIYNGPVPFRADAGVGRLRVLFADDEVMLPSYLATRGASAVGIRLRPPRVHSRFGAAIDRPEVFATLVAALTCAPTGQELGVCFHRPSSEIGMEQWEQEALSIIDVAAALERCCGRSFSLLDLGGGWSPHDVDHALPKALERIREKARSELVGPPRLLLEPGKALAEPAMALLTRVVRVRPGVDGTRLVTFDGGLAEVPLIRRFPHRIALVREDVLPLGPGPDALLGPSCMEADCLADAVELPGDLAVGDLLAILDAGAYDASTAFRFGRGSEAG